MIYKRDKVYITVEKLSEITGFSVATLKYKLDNYQFANYIFRHGFNPSYAILINAESVVLIKQLLKSRKRTEKYINGLKTFNKWAETLINGVEGQDVVEYYNYTNLRSCNLL